MSLDKEKIKCVLLPANSHQMSFACLAGPRGQRAQWERRESQPGCKWRDRGKARAAGCAEKDFAPRFPASNTSCWWAVGRRELSSAQGAVGLQDVQNLPFPVWILAGCFPAPAALGVLVGPLRSFSAWLWVSGKECGQGVLRQWVANGKGVAWSHGLKLVIWSDSSTMSRDTHISSSEPGA